jgi:hypothetical protein
MGTEDEVRKISVGEVTGICQRALKRVGANPQNALLTLEEYYDRAGKFAQQLTSTTPAAAIERVWMPGEITARRAEERKANGIAIKASILEEIKAYLKER